MMLCPPWMAGSSIILFFIITGGQPVHDVMCHWGSVGDGARTTHHFHTRRDVALHALTDRIYRHSSSVISLFVCVDG
jgi:hypothetical protein